jgi:hypothetical protein
MTDIFCQAQTQVAPERFIGRDNILDAIANAQKGNGFGSIYDIEILGPRGIGKTSVLRKIRSMQTKGLTVFLPGRNSDQIEFIEDLFQAIERELRELQGKPTSFMDQAAGLRQGNKSGTSALIEALSSLKDQNVLILLDDADNISLQALTALKSAINQLRSLQNMRVRMILTSSVPIKKRLMDGGLSLDDAFLYPLELKSFSLEETENLLIQIYPVWTRPSLRAVYSRTGGHLAFVQMYGYAYSESARSNEKFQILSSQLPELSDQDLAKKGLGENLFNVAKISGTELLSSEIIGKCHKKVKEAAIKWYVAGFLARPSKAEWKVIRIIAGLGGSATFKNIKDLYGRNPAPQLKRAVEKGALQLQSRGLYALPHHIIAEALVDRLSKEPNPKN